MSKEQVEAYEFTEREEPEWPTSGEEGDIVLTEPEWDALSDAIKALNKNKGGRIFFEFGDGDFTIETPEEICLKRGDDDSDVRPNYVVAAAQGCNVTLDAGEDHRVFHLLRNATLMVFGINFVNGVVKEAAGGAGLLVKPNTDVWVVGCTFRNNKGVGGRALEGGGGIKNLGGNLEVWRSTFEDNVATTGGGIAVTHGNISVFKSVFSRNVSTGAPDDSGFRDKLCNGGAIRVDRLRKGPDVSKPFFLLDSEFYENDTQELANGIIMEVWNQAEHTQEDGVLAVIKRCHFEGNGQNSPGKFLIMFHGQGNVLMNNNKFKNNKASKGLIKGRLEDPYRILKVKNIKFEENSEDSPCFMVGDCEVHTEEVEADGKNPMGVLEKGKKKKVEGDEEKDEL